MGKEHEDCCEACHRFGDRTIPDDDVLAVRDAPVLRASRPWLVVTRGGQITFEAPLAMGASIVGRMEGVEVCLDDVVISRRQCRFVRDDVGITVEDLDSACGTFLDGQRIRKGVLREGSYVLVGNSYLRIEPR